MEKEVERRLVEAIPSFKMAEFLELLVDRHEEVVGDVLDLLASFADFESFKEQMVDLREALGVQVGASSASSSQQNQNHHLHQQQQQQQQQQQRRAGHPCGLTVSVLPLHAEEMTTGIPMPDLNLVISPVARAPVQNKKTPAWR